jgi:hypothetical protein
MSTRSCGWGPHFAASDHGRSEFHSGKNAGAFYLSRSITRRTCAGSHMRQLAWLSRRPLVYEAPPETVGRERREKPSAA